MSTTELQSLSESKLIVFAATQARRVLDDPVVMTARNNAEGASDKALVTTPEDAALLVDRILAVKAGRGAIKDWKAKVLAIPKAMTEAINEAVRADAEGLEAAFKALDAKHTAWTLERDRLASIAAQALIDEARAASIAAQAEDEFAPPMVAVTPPPQNATRTAAGAAFGRSTLKCELVEPHEALAYDPELLELNDARAKDLYRARFEKENPEGGTFAGVRFWRERGSSYRRER